MDRTKKTPPASVEHATRFIDILNLNRERLSKLELMLQSMTGNVWEERSDIHKGITAIDRIMDELSSKEETRTGEEERKKISVSVMNLAVDYWAAETNTTRVELAEQSGLWNVYIGKDGWARTQTLDKYLEIKTLPIRPRWKNVIHTADFVLAACNDKNSQLRHDLENAVEQLRQIF